MGSKTIVVTGDFYRQENLLLNDAAHVTREDGLENISVQTAQGGAWRLAKLIAAMGFTTVTLPDSSPAARTFATWTSHPEITGVKKPARVWRVRKVLGAQPVIGAGFTEPSGASVLAIDDSDLGFSANSSAWPLSLSGDSNPDIADIVLHIANGFRKGPLWRRVFPELADKLTVVLPVTALRAAGAAITTPLSWDRTIEETVAEFAGDRFAMNLRLARRVIVTYGTDGAAIFLRRDKGLEFERCLYDPVHLESAWERDYPGMCLEVSRIVAASVVYHVAEPILHPLLLAVSNGLNAARGAHLRGGGSAKNPVLSFDVSPIVAAIRTKRSAEPVYYAAFPQSLLSGAQDPPAISFTSNLPSDHTGPGYQAALTYGIDTILRGPEKALKPVPSATFGRYYTVDRDEIERINSIRNLILAYLDNPEDKRPLSFAVFGPPGSGKSFAVKQLIEGLLGDSADVCDFNLTMFTGPADLHQAFHRVRDATVKGQIPFVFWDEFDTGELKWLKEFLAPMQDSNFFAGGLSHPFGKAVFVFAGGTAPTIEKFDRGPGDHTFRGVKGPDFVSRLRGYINVKGPNREDGQFAYIVRRAIMLRKALERHAGRLVDADTGRLAIDATLAWAFLTAGKYLHGARSLESIVTMSNLAKAHHFGPAELPAAASMKLHVEDWPLERKVELHLNFDETEQLSEAAHDAWRKAKEAAGYVYGPTKNTTCAPPTHPLIMDYAKLKEEDKESNRKSARSTLASLASDGYRLRRGVTKSPLVVDTKFWDRFSPTEHQRWLREVLQQGQEWGMKSNPDAGLHHCIVPYDQLGEEKNLDQVAVEAVLNKISDLGYFLSR